MAREKVGALVMLLFSISYGLMATRISLSFLSQQEVFSARTMPYGLAVVGSILALAILVLPTRDTEGTRTLGDVTEGMAWRKAIALVVIMISYGLIMKWVGFIFASVVFLIAGFYIMGERRIKRILVAAVPLVVFLWFVMSSLLGVYIAPGEIFYMLGII